MGSSHNGNTSLCVVTLPKWSPVSVPSPKTKHVLCVHGLRPCPPRDIRSDRIKAFDNRMKRSLAPGNYIYDRPINRTFPADNHNMSNAPVSLNFHRIYLHLRRRSSRNRDWCLSNTDDCRRSCAAILTWVPENRKNQRAPIE